MREALLWWSLHLDQSDNTGLWTDLGSASIYGCRLITKGLSVDATVSLAANAARLAEARGVRVALDLPGIRPTIGKAQTRFVLTERQVLKYHDGSPSDPSTPPVTVPSGVDLTPGMVMLAADGAIRVAVVVADEPSGRMELEVVSQRAVLQGVRSLSSVGSALLGPEASNHDIAVVREMAVAHLGMDAWVSNANPSNMAALRTHTSPEGPVLIPKVESPMSPSNASELLKTASYIVIGRSDLMRNIGPGGAMAVEREVVGAAHLAGRTAILGSGLDGVILAKGNPALVDEIVASYAMSYAGPTAILLTDACAVVNPGDARSAVESWLASWQH